MLDISTLYAYYLRYSNHTESAKVRDNSALLRLKPYFLNTDVFAVTRPMLRGYVEVRRAAGVQDSTINREFRSFRAALSFYMIDFDMNEHNPLSNFSLTEHEFLENYLTRKEARELLKQCEHYFLLHCYVTLLLETGCRSGQILKLTWEQIDFNKRILNFSSKATKGKKRLILPLSTNALETLAHMQNVQVLANFNDGLVFGGVQSFKKSFASAKKRAGLDKLRIHDLRHTFASWLVQSGTSIYVVQKLLGHSRIESTIRYSHLDVEHLRKFIK